MNTRVKGLLTAAIAAGGVLAAVTFTPASAWALPPGAWGSPGYYHPPVQVANYNNGGLFGGLFNRGNNYYRPPYGWNGMHRVGWRPTGGGYYRPPYHFGRRRFW